ncbi:MAG: lasso peptide biosynthesis B2 protein [Leptolyngbyaceae cyanobacterium CSU_1_4]|nr:lasso peptide biosynthesis B2 protein [Leptolyngbyaceae cyanobacterium CSU_1_4]
MKHLHKLKSLAQMSGSDRLHLLSAFLLLLLIRLSLRLLPFRIVLKLVQKLSNPGGVSRKNCSLLPPCYPISHIVWRVNVSSQYMPGGAKCLARALTTQVLLNQQGYLPDLRIGVAKATAGQLEAHAWVEYQGRVVMGQLNDLARYLPLPSLEGVKL